MPFHHFKGKNLSRSEKIQQLVVQELLTSKIPDSKRESSVTWELKHSSGVIQIARILADKRGLDAEIAEIAAALHDISVIVTGSYENHAKKGGELARNLLTDSGDFKHDEIATIVEAVECHSDKSIYSEKPYAELVKDADVLDCFLYGDDIYSEKPDSEKIHYLRRIILLRKELGMKEKKDYIAELARLGEAL
jgi:uncharacterized protein